MHGAKSVFITLSLSSFFNDDNLFSIFFIFNLCSCFLLFSLSFPECTHDFWGHLGQVGRKYGLEVAHICLEKWVVQNLIAQVESFSEKVLSSIDIGPWVFVGGFPAYLVLKSRDLQDDLDFRRVKSLELSFEFIDGLIFLNNSWAELFQKVCSSPRIFFYWIFFVRMVLIIIACCLLLTVSVYFALFQIVPLRSRHVILGHSFMHLL